MTSDKAKTLKDSISASIEKLATMTDETARSETFRQWVTAMGRFHSYSWGNQLLIAMQRPTATNIAGFQTWKKLGRHVKKGAKGIAILAPCVYRVKAADPDALPIEISRKGRTDTDTSETATPTISHREVHNFRVVYTFDVADTDGDPLPDLGEYRGDSGGDALLPKLEAAAARLGIHVCYEEIGGEAKGWSAGGKVAVKSSLSATAKCGTLAHECAHELLHQGEYKAEGRAKTQEQRELEAEATSFAVLAHFGIEQRSDLYLASWGATAAALTESLQTIRATVQTILDAIEAVPEETAEAA